MNMQMPVAADAKAFPLPGTQREAAFSTFAAKRPPPKNWRARCCGAAGVAFIYAALILVFIFAGQGDITTKIEPKAITVAIEAEPVMPVDIVPPPPVTPPPVPEIPDIVMPEFIVNTPPPENAITLPPPPPVSPPSPPAPPPIQTAAPAEDVMSPYVERLLRHLYRHKRYPQAARRNHEEGVAVVEFLMDRRGHILSARIANSSGSRALDDEALAVVRRAEPLPRIPDDMPEDQLQFAVPVEFFLR